MFLKEISYADQGYTYLIKNTVKTVIHYEILLYYSYINIIYNNRYPF